MRVQHDLDITRMKRWIDSLDSSEKMEETVGEGAPLMTLSTPLTVTTQG